jgi:hypothetical protein
MGAASCFAPSAASIGRGVVIAQKRLAVMQINENLDIGAAPYIRADGLFFIVGERLAPVNPG